MKEILWKNEFSVSVEELDAHHKIILELVNELRRGNTDAEQEDDLLTILYQYADLHFSLEERLMEQSGYTDLEKHKELHDEFRSTIAKLRTDVSGQRDTFSGELLEYLNGWWASHILTEDMKYSQTLNKHGFK